MMKMYRMGTLYKCISLLDGDHQSFCIYLQRIAQCDAKRILELIGCINDTPYQIGNIDRIFNAFTFHRESLGSQR